MFAEGDRIQFRAPFSEHRIANGELGSVGQITEEELTVALDSGREVSFEIDKFRHLDHGYAVTSYSSQSQTVDRVLVNADANESDLLLNQRMGYVAISRAREDALIFTNSTDRLKAALDRNVNKGMAVEAVRETNSRDSSPHRGQEHWANLNNQMDDQQSQADNLEDSRSDQNREASEAAEEVQFDMTL